MTYEWDETKRQTNIRKHGIDFTQVEEFEWETARIQAYLRYREQRFTAYGYISNHLYVLVYTEPQNKKRIVSLRRATKRERKRHAAT